MGENYDSFKTFFLYLFDFPFFNLMITNSDLWTVLPNELL